MKHEYYFKNINVIVRPLEKDDIELLRKWRNDSQNTKYLKKVPYITTDMQNKWFENYIENGDEIFFAIEECNDLNRLVGSAALYNFDGETVEFGKILIGDKDAHGKNVGSNALKAILKIAFTNLSIKKVMLRCYKDNKKALRIYRNVGFNIEEEHLVNENIEYTMKIEKNEDFF